MGFYKISVLEHQLENGTFETVLRIYFNAALAFYQRTITIRFIYTNHPGIELNG